MKKAAVKTFILSFLTGLFILGAFFLCRFLAENIFFDKLIYKKSSAYGYDSKIDKSVRAADLMSYIYNVNTYPRVLGSSTSGKFTIVIIGDSFVYGVGIKNEQRFANLLEAKLNKIRPTRVIVLSQPGDSFLDNYIKYKKVSQEIKPDLYIFGLVDNDLLFNSPNPYDQKMSDQIISKCSQPVIYNISDKLENYQETLAQSLLPNSGNHCVFDSFISDLPKNAIYLDLLSITGPYFPMGTYKNMLSSAGLTYMSSEAFYKSHIKNYHPLFHFGHYEMHVSDIETHPSALANTVFADFLFQEVTNNLRWGFGTYDKSNTNYYDSDSYNINRQ